MISSASWILVAIFTASPAAATPARTPVGSDEKRARDAYDADRYEEAALAYEALWAASQVPKYLYNAGLSREGLGHLAHAAAHWQLYLRQPELGPEDRAKAEARVRSVHERTTIVAIEVFPAALAATEGTVEAVYLGPSSMVGRVTLTFTLAELRSADGRLALHLEPGNWTVRLAPTGGTSGAYKPAEEKLTVGAGQRATRVPLGLAPVLAAVTVELPELPRRGGVDIEFRDGLGLGADERLSLRTNSALRKLRVGPWAYEARARHATLRGNIFVAPDGATLRLEFPAKAKASPEQRVRLGLGLGLGLPSVAAIVAGAVVVNLGEDKFKKVDLAVEDPKPQLGAANDMSAAGAGITGAGVGLLAGSLTGAVRPASRSAWLTELGLGAVAAAGGVTWFALGLDTYWDDVRKAEKTEDPTELPDTSARWHSLMGAGLTGLGLGLVTGSVTGLVVSRKIRNQRSGRYTLNPGIARSSISLHLSGQF